MDTNTRHLGILNARKWVWHKQPYTSYGMRHTNSEYTIWKSVFILKTIVMQAGKQYPFIHTKY
jgi:hypothetical protein